MLIIFQDHLKVYQSASVGTIDYTTGDVVLTKINIATVGAGRWSRPVPLVRLTVQPASNDVVPVRNQDITNRFN